MADEPKISLDKVVDHFKDLTKDTPWWYRAMVMPMVLVLGLIWAKNPGLGETLGNGLLGLLENLRHDAKDAGVAIRDRLHESGTAAINGLRNYFDGATRRLWLQRAIAYAVICFILIIIGMLSHDTSILLFLGTAALLGPILIAGSLLASIPETANFGFLKKAGLAGVRVVALIILGIVGWMFIGNMLVYGTMLTLWFGILLIAKFSSKTPEGLRPTLLSLGLFIGLCLVAKVGTVVYDHNKPFHRTVDSLNYATLGKTARWLGVGGTSRETGERPEMEVVNATQLWEDVPSDGLPNNVILNLDKGKRIIANVTQMKEDGFGLMYYDAIYKEGPTFWRGWVPLRDVLKVQAASLSSANTANQQTSQNSPADTNIAYDVSKGEIYLTRLSGNYTVQAQLSSSSIKWDGLDAEKIPGHPRSHCGLDGTPDSTPRGLYGTDGNDYPAPDYQFGALLSKLNQSSWIAQGSKSVTFNGLKPNDVITFRINDWKFDNNAGIVRIRATRT